MLNLAFLKHNLGLKIVSILLGFSLWLYVKSTEAVQISNSFSVPLQVSSLSPDVEIIAIPKTVSVTVRGPIEQLSKINMTEAQKSFGAFVDLSEIEAGQVEPWVDVAVPQNLQQFTVSWERRVTVITERIERRELAVQVIPIGATRDGLEFANASVEPSRVVVQGSTSEIRKIGQVRVMLDLARIEAGSSAELKVEVLDADQRPMNGLRIVPDQVTVKPAFTTAAPKRLVIVVPKFSGELRAGLELVDYSVEPYQILVAGSNRDLQTMSNVETLPIDLARVAATGTVTVGLNLPSEVRTAGSDRVKVRLVLKPVKDTIPGTVGGTDSRTGAGAP